MLGWSVLGFVFFFLVLTSALVLTSGHGTEGPSAALAGEEVAESFRLAAVMEGFPVSLASTSGGDGFWWAVLNLSASEVGRLFSLEEMWLFALK
jgi:hypothetical protein